ncbi:adenylosuccinate lyase [Clostridia bacterium]|nr:adenylosuccinate lyase [Clostridia bacterium]
MDVHDGYQTPLGQRYASAEMQGLFSDNHKFRLWRKLWIALAKAENRLGLPVTAEQIAELEANAEDIDYEAAAKYEKSLRHDVMAHIHAWGDCCPTARPIIHLGATSCYVGDNADALITRDALKLTLNKLLGVVENLKNFALEYKALPTLGYTHFQAAQPTTVGKRAALWLYDFALDVDEVARRIDGVRLLGNKGATGTQASFLDLFEGDRAKIRELERLIAAEFDMPVVPVSGQTYTRKFDYFALSALSGIAQSASKMATDLRLLAHLKEIFEPSESRQIGSSAMPYKRNPMRCERICGLARDVIITEQNAAFTAATQWMERTLDDSANRRLSLPEAFLATDGVLNLCLNVTGGLVVNRDAVERHLLEEMPNFITENVLMEAVKRGEDRQEVHEKIRQASRNGTLSDIVPLSAQDPKLYIGRAPEQVDELIEELVQPLLDRYPNRGHTKATINV